MGEDFVVTVKLKVRLSFWEAVKVRIAGPAAARVLDAMLEEREIPPDDRT